MRIATRLVLTLSFLFAGIVIGYALFAQQQREELIGDALIRETETLARALQIVVNNDLRDGHLADLGELLLRVLEDPETFSAAVLDEQGQLLVGGADDATSCLQRAVREQQLLETAPSGWADCGARVRWVVLPVREPGTTLVVARYATLMEEEIAHARSRHLLLTLVLVGAATLAVVATLRRTLVRPLAAVMDGVRSLSTAGPVAPIRVSGDAGELAGLASAFNEMAEQLEARRLSLLRQAEERLALERRLAEAESYAMLGRLSGGLAHEVGSPLNVIGVRAEAIEASTDCAPAVRAHATGILAEVERLAELVRGLLHAARRHGVASEPVDLADVVRLAVQDVRSEDGAAAVEIEVALPDGPVIVGGDATLLRHAVLNLARNAVQALADRASPRRLRLAIEQDDGTARIVVDDNGPGMPRAVLEHVYEPFFTTKDIGGGTGLGLPISRGIAEEHGGTLEIESAEGRGTRCVLTLPRDGALSTDSEAA